jgi:hypothetical protein
MNIQTHSQRFDLTVGPLLDKDTFRIFDIRIHDQLLCNPMNSRRVEISVHFNHYHRLAASTNNPKEIIIQALKNYFIAIFSKGSVRVWYNVSDQRVTITTKAVDSNDISVCPIENADEIACLQAFREGCAAIQK